MKKWRPSGERKRSEKIKYMENGLDVKFGRYTSSCMTATATARRSFPMQKRKNPTKGRRISDVPIKSRSQCFGVAKVCIRRDNGAAWA